MSKQIREKHEDLKIDVLQERTYKVQLQLSSLVNAEIRIMTSLNTGFITAERTSLSESGRTVKPVMCLFRVSYAISSAMNS